VTETIQYESFDPTAEQAAGADAPAGERDVPAGELTRLGEIPMELSVELGRTHMSVAETLELRAGSVVVLERAAGAAADLLVNGTPIARGEVVVVDEQYGLRVREILDGAGEGGAAPAAAEPAPQT